MQLIVLGANGQNMEPAQKSVVEATKHESEPKPWNHAVVTHAQETILRFSLAIHNVALVRG